ncbi:MAG: hypothetical protein JW934_03740, partial [Anaerolineae bacterium]|nr:hypothetical protein [Anaerolineae bacterium]
AIDPARLQYLTNDRGQRMAVVVDIQTWDELIEALEDALDAADLLQTKEEEQELIPWEQVIAEYQAENPDAEV